MKVILSIIALLLLCSCEPAIQKKIRTPENVSVYTYRFEFEGHHYIEFHRYSEPYDNNTGYVHDPDCPCHKSE